MLKEEWRPNQQKAESCAHGAANLSGHGKQLAREIY
jgi:hypothetical protein